MTQKTLIFIAVSLLCIGCNQGNKPDVPPSPRVITDSVYILLETFYINDILYLKDSLLDNNQIEVAGLKNGDRIHGVVHFQSIHGNITMGLQIDPTKYSSTSISSFDPANVSSTNIDATIGTYQYTYVSTIKGTDMGYNLTLNSSVINTGITFSINDQIIAEQGAITLKN